MTKVKRLTLTVLCMAGLSAWGQTPADTLPARWDLQTCIDYALAHNITVQKSRISAESSEEDLKTSKSALFPSLNASMSQRIVNSQHHERNHHQRRQHQHQPKQDIVQRLLRHRRQLDPLQRRPPAEHHQAERTEPTHCLPGRQREREQHSGEHRPDLRADTLRRRSSESERSHLGDQPGAIRTGQATA